MTHTISRQANANTNNAFQMTVTEKNISGAKEINSREKENYSLPNKATVPKRYSVDDNGGGYGGL